MKKTRIFALLAAMAMGLVVFGCSNGDSGGSECGSTTGGSESGTTGGTTSGSIEPNPEGFVKIPAASIKGTESWTPESKVFVSGRKLEIALFYMSDHEVTRGEYKAVMGIDPSTAKAYDKDGNMLTGDDNVKNNPVNNISWYDALVYCNTLSIKEGLTPCYAIGGSINPGDWGSVPTSLDDTWNAATCDSKANGYRLPTEAEWEWAARGGESYIYAGSNTIGDVAWYTENTNDTGTRDVKTKKANGYGLYDMSGNVWEWCWDRDSDISEDTPATGPDEGYSSSRCLRGGSWYFNAFNAQVAVRFDHHTAYDRSEAQYERYYDYERQLALASSVRKLLNSFRFCGSTNPRSNPIWVQKEGADLASGAAAAGEAARLEHSFCKKLV